ncbi:MAG: hypothetical protein JNN04_04225 [Cyclobacteriaceae bacterium]|nr:hypothetical protein [Cyclobacteriaceae bacterium]
MRTVTALVASLLFMSYGEHSEWLNIKKPGYTYFYQEPDRERIQEYGALVDGGLQLVSLFFQQPFPKPFEVYVHPTRLSWDEKLRAAYQMPDFKSECWMVASGDGFQLNMISPITWDTAACEHRYGDKVATQSLITHELVHVFHGQHNPNPDFTAVEGIDWLVEGLATYASGQLTADRLAGVETLVKENKTPTLLDNFWKGQHRYGLSGSVVKYIDQKYGRQKLLSLLAFTRKDQVLQALNLSEPQLLADWKNQFGH